MLKKLLGTFAIAISIAFVTNVWADPQRVEITKPIASGSNVIGSVSVSSINVPLPAGNNNIGKVDLASSIPAGTNVIGSVTVSQFTTPLPTGNNNIGNVGLLAGQNLIGSVTILGSVNKPLLQDSDGRIIAVVQPQVATTEKNAVSSISSLAAGATVRVGTITLSANQTLVIQGLALSSTDFPYMVATLKMVVGTTTETYTDLGQVAISPSNGYANLPFERSTTIKFNDTAVNNRCEIFIEVTNLNTTDAANGKVLLKAYIQ